MNEVKVNARVRTLMKRAIRAAGGNPDNRSDNRAADFNNTILFRRAIGDDWAAVADMFYSHEEMVAGVGAVSISESGKKGELAGVEYDIWTEAYTRLFEKTLGVSVLYDGGLSPLFLYRDQYYASFGSLLGVVKKDYAACTSELDAYVKRASDLYLGPTLGEWASDVAHITEDDELVLLKGEEA